MLNEKSTILNKYGNQESGIDSKISDLQGQLQDAGQKDVKEGGSNTCAQYDAKISKLEQQLNKIGNGTGYTKLVAELDMYIQQRDNAQELLNAKADVDAAKAGKKSTKRGTTERTAAKANYNTMTQNFNTLLQAMYQQRLNS